MSRRRLEPRTLRRQLTIVLIVVVSAMAAAIVLLSAIPLNNSLVSQLDNNLRQASSRAVNATPNRLLQGGTALPQPGDDMPGATSSSSAASPDEATQDPTQDNGFGARPPGLGYGQSAGTIALFDSGSNIQAGYFDANGEFATLTGVQIAALTTVPTDGEIYTITIPDLGVYHAISAAGQSGDRSITALPMKSVTATVGGFVLGASIVGVITIGLAALLGALLIKRALTPLDHLARTAQAISRLPLDHATGVAQRVPENVVGSSKEVTEVANSVNAMLTHIDNAFAARDASESKLRSFVADASHELRTPLASVRGYAELMLRNPSRLDDDDIQSLSRVHAESTRMGHLVEDLLLLARLDDERPLESVDFDGIPAVIEAVADAHVTGPTHQWHLDLAVNDDEEIERISLHGDEGAFRQIVVNLISNARVHTPEGTSVTVSLRAVDGVARFTVTDDGPGIPVEIQDRIFDRFVKADASRTPGKGSSGLGLSIVAALTHAQHGTVNVTSVPGKTVFQVSLPLGD